MDRAYSDSDDPVKLFRSRFLIDLVLLLARMRRGNIASEGDARMFVAGVTVLGLTVALGVDIPNQLISFRDWPSTLKEWGLTVAIVLVLAIPIARLIAKAQLDLYRVKQMHAALGATMEAVVRAASPDDLYTLVAAAICDTTTFASVAIATGETNAASFNVRAIAGPAARFEAPFVLPMTSALGGGVLSGLAFLEGRPVVTGDWQTNPRCVGAPLNERSREVHSVAAIPILRGGKSVGVILFTAAELQAFDPTVVDVMTRLPATAIGLDKLEEAEQRANAQARITYLAERRNVLTGLPNRMKMSAVLRTAMEPAAKRCGLLGIICLDLDLL